MRMSGKEQCLLCHRDIKFSPELGRLYMKASIKAHYHCLVFSKNMHQRGKTSLVGIKGFLTSDILDVLESNKNQVCMFCDRGNASIQCSHLAGCEQTFHLPCGLDGGALHQYFDNFQSYCPKHRPRQEVLVSAVLPDRCSICLQGWSRKRKPRVSRPEGKDERRDESEDKTDEAEASDDDELGHYSAGRREDEVLWAPCCKFTAAFHRQCVKRMAETSGYFFKCPCCCNQEVFTLAMQRLGIYVPQEDPVWQLERQAFEEMSQPPKVFCSAEHCKCVSGPDFNRKNTLWEMAKCSTCAAEGLHKACGGIALETSLENWQCTTCSIIVAPNNVLNEPISTRLTKAFNKGKQDMPSTSKMPRFQEQVTPRRRPVPRSAKKATPTTMKTRASSTVTKAESSGNATCHGDAPSSSFPRTGFEPLTPSIDFINKLLLSSVFKVGKTGIKEICSQEFGFKAVCHEENRSDEPWN